jgi:F420-dependent oxidoreductase-like protein
VQMSARQPAATAMAAMTLDHLSNGRFILGIGASGPQVVEGWYGMPFEKPLARTREYVGILREIWARQGPVTNAGAHYPLPLAEGPGVTGLGKPLKSSIHPLRVDIPIFLAAEGPKNVSLAAELCDGWMAMLLSPHEQFYAEALAEGFARPGARAGAEEFEVAAMVPFIVHDDVEAAVDMVRPFYALYFGGMGAKGGKNFHANVAIRMGYEAEITEIQELYLDGKKNEAAAIIPSELIQKMSLLGPGDKIRHDLEAWRDSFVTTLLIAGDPPLLRQAAEIVLA